MKLHTGRRAPNPRRVRWFMAEKGINDIEIVELDLFKGEHRGPDHLGRIGFSHVPSLELDDGTILTETVAICRYLESHYPEPNMFGRDPREAAEIEMWTRRTELLFANPLMAAVRQGHPAFSALGSQTPEVAAFNHALATSSLDWIDARLEGRDYLAADRITIADIVAIASLDFAKLIKFSVPDAYTNVHRWRAVMAARSAAGAGM